MSAREALKSRFNKSTTVVNKNVDNTASKAPKTPKETRYQPKTWKK
jgi:hypothetical protein